MNKPKLSICMFAYKQYNQVKKFLDLAKTISANNIEVLISDDTKDDSIKKLVESYQDIRFKHIFNTKGSGADSNYLNAMEEAAADYVWIFRSTDIMLPDKVESVIDLIEKNLECSLYHFSSCAGEECIERMFIDEKKRYTPEKYDSKKSSLWRSGTLHPSGFIVNKEYCDFTLYREYISKFFDDYMASNVAFFLQLADLALKGEVFFSSLVAWKYADTLKRTDTATNAPGGKNPFGLDFEYKRYQLMFDYSSSIKDVDIRESFQKVIVHTFAKQILHVFGKRNSNPRFLKHYGCEPVDFNPVIERKKFISVSQKLFERYNSVSLRLEYFMRSKAFFYGIIKPFVYKVRN